MANSDKNILIVPNTNQTGLPNIRFVGSSSAPISLSVLDDNTLSFSGSQGQLFSINNNLTSGTIFSVNDVSGIPSIEVDASGTITLGEFGGNVGINTNATQTNFAKFVVRPQANNIIALTQINNSSSIISWNDVGTSNTLRLAGNPIAFTGDGGSGAEHARINSAGNFGIGTNNPSNKLHVKSSGEIVSFETTSGTGNNYLRFKNAASNLGYFGWGSSGNNHLNISNEATGDITFIAGGPERLRISGSNGNVGIGTTTPQQALDVVGSMRLSTGDIYRPDNAGIAIEVGNGTNSYFGTHLFRNGVGTNERMRITDGGNVGIGTTNPNNTLEVIGTISSSNTIRTAQNLIVNGGTIDSLSSSATLFNSPSNIVAVGTSCQQLLLGLNATDVRIGNNSGNGTTLINNDLYVRGNEHTLANVNGGSTTLTVSGSGLIGSAIIIDSGVRDGLIIFKNSSLLIKPESTNGIAITNTGILEAYSGIQFSVTGEVLSSYEEGTWTPALSGSTTAGSLTLDSSGFFTKVGNIVYINGYIACNSAPIPPVGIISMTGLPFSATSFRSSGIIFTDARGINNKTLLQGNITSGTAIMNIWADSTATDEILGSDVPSWTAVRISFFGQYRTSV